jgi:PKD repeat protein
VGKSAAYTAAALDTWSPVSSYVWGFGDGKTATGPSVTHVFAKPGTYPVTLTVSDAVGNTTTLTATTKVSWPMPVIKVLKLRDDTIALGARTKLKVRLNTPAVLRLVLKGKRHDIRVVIRKKLPQGTSRITVKTAYGKKLLVPDLYVIKARAKNPTGTSPTKKTQLKVVR